MTAPILRRLPNSSGGSGEGPEPPRCCSRALPGPLTLVCSGMLPSELDEVAAAFAPAGLIEADRRRDGDWAALLLRRG